MTFLDVFLGRGLNARDRAARVLALLLGTAVILMVVSAMANGYRSTDGLSDGGAQLLIGVLTLLVGTVSGYLARRQDQDADEGRAPVGTILTAALGTTMVICAGVSAVDALFSPDPGMSSNMSTVLSAVLGGGIGAASAYLGLPRPEAQTGADGLTQTAAALRPPDPAPVQVTASEPLPVVVEDEAPRGPDL